MSTASAHDEDWTRDAVTTLEGVTIPVRATARRPGWGELPAAVRSIVVRLAGAEVVRTSSAGTGFTPGFASRLDLVDGRRIFVKAASSGYDDLHGWALTDAYREEIRKLRLLPTGIGAPALLWSVDEPVDAHHWVVLGFQCVDGRPPRRPWRDDELHLVAGMLAEIAPRMAHVPDGLHLGTFEDDFGEWPEWLAQVRARDGMSDWVEAVAALAQESVPRCAGSGMAHLDLRDDNLLIDRDNRVWICDWNFPMLAAPWIDLVGILLSAHGDGVDVAHLVTRHPLTRDVEARSIDSLLANLWLYFTTRRDAPVPPHSPHLRDHQAWYAEAATRWLGERIGIAAPGGAS